MQNHAHKHSAYAGSAGSDGKAGKVVVVLGPPLAGTGGRTPHSRHPASLPGAEPDPGAGGRWTGQEVLAPAAPVSAMGAAELGFPRWKQPLLSPRAQERSRAPLKRAACFPTESLGKGTGREMNTQMSEGTKAEVA